MSSLPEPKSPLADTCERKTKPVSGLHGPFLDNEDSPGPDPEPNGNANTTEACESAPDKPSHDHVPDANALFPKDVVQSPPDPSTPSGPALEETHQPTQEDQLMGGTTDIMTWDIQEALFPQDGLARDVTGTAAPDNIFDSVDIGAITEEELQELSALAEDAFPCQEACDAPTNVTDDNTNSPVPLVDTCIEQSGLHLGEQNMTKVEEQILVPTTDLEQPVRTDQPGKSEKPDKLEQPELQMKPKSNPPEQPPKPMKPEHPDEKIQGQHAQPKHPEAYMWTHQGGRAPEEHIDVMEEAVDAAIRSGLKLVSILGRAPKMHMPIDVRKWADEFEAICKEHRNFRVRIGLVGATGAGKTTLLNALLDHNELLPSGCEGAATGVPCTVRHSREMDKPFRAEVKFCSRKAVFKWLVPIMEDVKDKCAHDENEGEEEDGAEDTEKDDGMFVKQAQEEDDSDFNMNILKPVHAVWKYDEDDLKSMTAEEVIESDKTIARLLSSKKVITDDDLLEFSQRIRPYLDCTAHPDITGPNGGDVELWPLVERVELFVTAPILGNGVELQDLPGLGDSVALRAERAQENFQSQDIMVVVTPAVRASDEKVAGDLITENQAVRMQMNGRLDKNSLCVVTSKVDDQQWETYASRDLRSAKYSNVQETFEVFRELKSKSGILSEQIKNKARLIDELQADYEVSECARDNDDLEKNRAQLETAKTSLAKLVQRKDAATKLLRYYKGLLAFQCGQVRNGRIRGKLQAGFKLLKKRLLSDSSRRQVKKASSHTNVGSEKDDRDDDIAVLPVSARAYWDLTLSPGEEDVCSGFPDASYTGVPALRKWLRNATIPARRTHAEALLHRLQVLLGLVSTLFKDEPPRQLKSSEERRHLVDTIIQPFIDTLEENLHVCGPGIAKRVRKCNPLAEAAPVVDKNGKTKAAPFRLRRGKEIQNLVKSWIFRDPRNPEKFKNAKVNWGTQKAILVRNGGLYKSGGANPVEYSWISDMSSCVLLEVVDRWNENFQGRLPVEATHAKKVLGEVWDTSLLKLRKLLPSYFPDELDFLGQQLAAIMAIRDSVSNEIAMAMCAIAKQAEAIHPKVEGVLFKWWSNTFKRTRAMSGRGVLLRRQAALETYAANNTTKIVKKALGDMEVQIGKTIDGFDKTLEKIWATGMQQIRAQVDALLIQIGGTLDAKPADAVDGDASTRATNIRQEAKALLVYWQDSWTIPDVLGRMTHVVDTDIPHYYVAEPPEDEMVDVWSESESEDVLPVTKPVQRKPRQPRKRLAPDAGMAGKPPAPKRRRGPAAGTTPRKPRAPRKAKEATK